MLVPPLRLRPAAAALLAAGAVAAALSQPGSAEAHTSSPRCGPNAEKKLSDLGVSGFRGMLRCLINEQRANFDLDPSRAGVQAPPQLATNSLLTTAAQRHTDDMVARRYFCHMATEPDPVTPTGALICDAPSSPAPNGRTFQDRLRTVGYCSPGCAASGENIYEAYPSFTPHQVFDSWMASTPHRQNIRNPRFLEIGVGVAAKHAKTGNPGGTVTVNFGTRL
jgi:uncharacterized protein YkwD